MKELIVPEKINAIQLFEGKAVDPLLESIREQAMSIVPDVTTAKGRKEIASLAHNVAKSKTFLDGAGKELVSGIKQKAKIIDSERKKLRDGLDALKKEVREPLTVWEDAEKERIESLNRRILEMSDARKDRDDFGDAYSIEYLSERLSWLKSIEIDDSFEDRAVEAAREKDGSISRLEKVICDLKKEAEVQAEVERLRKEAEERERKEQEERLRIEGEERARREAEEEAKREKERVEKERIETALAEKRKIELAEKEKEAALEAKREAERKAIAAEEKAKVEAEEARKLAERQVAEAARVERERIEDEKRARDEARAKREKDKKHMASINNAVVSSLTTIGLSEEDAKLAVVAIATGKVPHTNILY